MSEHNACGVIVSVITPGIHKLSGRIDSSGNNSGNGFVARQTRVTYPENRVDALVIQKSEFHSVRRVDKNDYPFEVFFQEVYHGDFSTRQLRIGLFQIAVLRACARHGVHGYIGIFFCFFEQGFAVKTVICLLIRGNFRFVIVRESRLFDEYVPFVVKRVCPENVVLALNGVARFGNLIRSALIVVCN